MEKGRQTSVFENGLIWFGTGLSIAEILTGTYFAPLGSRTGLADCFILKKDSGRREADVANLLIWLAGFILYRLLMRADLPVGSTLPDVAATIVLCLAAERLRLKRPR